MSKNGKVPRYRKHKASGQAVVTLSGRDFYLGVHGTRASREKYAWLIAQWEALGQQLPPEQGFTINELIVSFWKHCERHYRKNGKPTSELSNYKIALGPLRKLYGREQAADFGPLKLTTIRNEMVQRSWVRTSINRHVGRITRMFKWGAAHELVPASVYQSLQTLAGLQKGRTEAVESEPVKPVPDHLIDAVRPFVPRQVWAMIELQRLTGMRPGEVLIMRSCDIHTGGRVWMYVPESHKTEHHGRGREVFLGPRAQTMLNEFWKTDLQAYLFSPRDAIAEHRDQLREERKSPVQPSQWNRRKSNPKRQPGEKYTVYSYRSAIVRGCERAFGMPEDLQRISRTLDRDERDRRRHLASEWRAEHCWHPNQLRHNAATRARREAGLEAAQIICGHAKADVTQVYAERDRQQAISYMAQFG
ncbi:site-specific integrase [Thalassoroseus pseudoceratinae]|uniref:tyrosine-type recombinase/integrase n=1 Tax=Thalassoroseus pseudoceratinae TaxID=2713176 RepID=UPI00142143A8|nr:tyrosine-type recombinase/integrase [Thalassoroseus pseudoceratinae]